MEILKNIKTGKYKGDFVTVAEAALRCRSKNTPIINKDHGEEWEYQMSLHVNDLVSIEHENVAGVYRVQKLSATDSIVSVRLHTAAKIKLQFTGFKSSTWWLQKLRCVCKLQRL